MWSSIMGDCRHCPALASIATIVENRTLIEPRECHRVILKSRLILRFLIVIVVFGALLFIPAGSLRFWQGWVYILTSFVSALFAFAYFYRHDPELIERRMQFKEKVPEQKRLMALVYTAWLIAFMLPGLDHRFGWSHLPLWVTVFSQVVVIGGYAMTFWVSKVNTFAARTIQVEPDQKVISSGPYRLVRHPMHSGVCAMWLFTPLALGSYCSASAGNGKDVPPLR
jgi:protein-S-isoprenylcysteine O-methyltransferase Ste14